MPQPAEVQTAFEEQSSRRAAAAKLGLRMPEKAPLCVTMLHDSRHAAVTCHKQASIVEALRSCVGQIDASSMKRAATEHSAITQK